MATLVVNDLISEYTVSELIGKLKELEEFKENQIAEDYFLNYCNRIFSVNSHELTSIELDKKYKFLFLKMTSLFNNFTPILESHPQLDALIDQFNHK